MYGDNGPSDLTVGAMPAGNYTPTAIEYPNSGLGGKETGTRSVSFTVASSNTPGTGTPDISGTPQVGQKLTATIGAIHDADGIDNAVFTHQWLAGSAGIASANSAEYTLTATEQGNKIRVRVSFQDDDRNEEALTSAATGPVEPPDLTVAVTTHDGSTEFTFEIRFSEERHATFSYRTLRDQAFVVTGGEVRKAQRLQREPLSNISWQIAVQPSVDGDVTVVLPATADCDVEGAICTRDVRKLSNRTELTVPRPGG